MASLKNLLDTRIQNLESSPLTFVNGIESELVRKLKEMTDLLSSLSINSQGQIINTADNLSKINEITQGLGDVYYDDQYIESLRTFAQDFDKQLNLNKELLRELGDFSDDALFSQTMRAGQNTTVNALSRTAVNTHLLDPIREMLTVSVTTSAKFSEAVEFIKTQIGLNPDIDSRWTRHAKQIAFDSFAISDRQTATLMAKQNGYINYLYYGTKKDTTRCFCLDRLLKVYPEEQYKKWGRREDLGQCDIGGGWAGMNDQTNEDNILVFMGGWNCRHVPMAVQEGFNTKTVGGDGGGKVETFTPAKTFKDAVKFTIENNLATEIRGLPKASLDTLNAMNASLFALKQKHGVTFDKIQVVNRKPKKFWIPAEHRIEIKDGFVNSRTLEINQAHIDWATDLEGSIEKYLQKNKAWFVSKNLKDIINHEAGHLVTIGQFPTKTQIVSWQGRVAAKRDVWRTFISGYGRTHGEEALAEIYALFKSQGRQALKAEWIDFFNEFSTIKI